ncbi:MAG: 50S ribosomal protein L28 [Bacilli bacterium]|nr:50S ribosomal protein L28 [Bacilli bacterium]
MANKVTSKKLNFANNKSHANNKTNRQQKLNFQKVTIDGVTIKTTAREARTFKKNA